MGYTREIEILEMTADGIRPVKTEDMPNLLVDASSASYNDEVYVFGGFDFGPKSFQGLSLDSWLVVYIFSRT